jgi:hypothetical protein
MQSNGRLPQVCQWQGGGVQGVEMVVPHESQFLCQRDAPDAHVL